MSTSPGVTDPASTFTVPEGNRSFAYTELKVFLSVMYTVLLPFAIATPIGKCQWWFSKTVVTTPVDTSILRMRLLPGSATTK